MNHLSPGNLGGRILFRHSLLGTMLPYGHDSHECSLYECPGLCHIVKLIIVFQFDHCAHMEVSNTNR